MPFDYATDVKSVQVRVTLKRISLQSSLKTKGAAPIKKLNRLPATLQISPNIPKNTYGLEAFRRRTHSKFCNNSQKPHHKTESSSIR